MAVVYLLYNPLVLFCPPSWMQYPRVKVNQCSVPSNRQTNPCLGMTRNWLTWVTHRLNLVLDQRGRGCKRQRLPAIDMSAECCQHHSHDSLQLNDQHISVTNEYTGGLRCGGLFDLRDFIYNFHY